VLAIQKCCAEWFCFETYYKCVREVKITGVCFKFYNNSINFIILPKNAPLKVFFLLPTVSSELTQERVMFERFFVFVPEWQIGKTSNYQK